MRRLVLYVPCAMLALIAAPAAAATLDGATLPATWGIPFVGILLSIAVFPLVAPKVWHHHFGKIAAAWALALLIPFAAAFGCVACGEQVRGSPFLRNLNAGDETPGDVSYTQVETNHDEVVTPYTSAFLAEGPQTTNVLLQDKCPPDFSEHLGIGHDPIALAWVENALGRPGPADPAFDPGCQVPSASSASR